MALSAERAACILMVKYLAVFVPALAALVLFFATGRSRHDPPARQPNALSSPSSVPITRARPSDGSEIRGRAAVLDADTLEIAGQRVRIYGIDAPERSQTCERAGGTWPCGLEATAALTRLVAGNEVRCETRDRDRNQRAIAVCWLNQIDVGRWLVEAGWAVAYRRFSGAYVDAEEIARGTRSGIWSGPFEPPEDYRRSRRQGSQD